MTIRIDGHKDEISLNQRAAEILRRLVEEQGHIQEIPVGRWVVNFSGRKVQTEITKSLKSSEMQPAGVTVKFA